MSMFELAHNSCYCKDGVARYRDFENDIDARDLARELAWSLADIELSNDNECFDEEMIENLNNLRNNEIDIDSVIIKKFMSRDNYQEAFNYFLEEEIVTKDLIVQIGINRKSDKYDERN